MSVGTNLLVQVLEAFARHNPSQRTFRRLYCEAGQVGTKAYQYVNDPTKRMIDEISSKCNCSSRPRFKTSTVVMVFEDLAKVKEYELLAQMYVHNGGPSRQAYNVCNERTRNIIQKLGLCQSTKRQ